MRIIAGTHRSRRLEVPESDDIRPTTDKAREALFSMLTHALGSWDGARVLDACCGSGALGLEAISRGAAFAVFIDSSTQALALARRNAEGLKEQGKCRFIAGSVLTPPPADEPCDILLMDAPYEKGLSEAGLAALTKAGWVNPAALAVIEVARDESFTPPTGWLLQREKEHGPARLLLLQKQPA